LSGWKEISAYFGKSDRTVQRWARDHGLPVRRKSTGGRPMVFAIQSELEAWQLTDQAAAARATPDDHSILDLILRRLQPSASRSRQPSWARVAVVVAALAIILPATASLVWLAFGPSGPLRAEPADWQVYADTLAVANARGDRLW